MQETNKQTNKQVFQISDEGIIFMDYLPADFSTLVEHINENDCILIFDSEESCKNLKQKILQYFLEFAALN